MDQKLASLPQAKGSATHIAPQLDATLKQAMREAEKLKDQYVSTEHLLLALLESKSPSAEALRHAGVTRDRLLQVLKEIRGNQTVDDPNAEDRFQALERYGRDLTEEARKGKLDPVIGRDEEIRRVRSTVRQAMKRAAKLFEKRIRNDADRAAGNGGLSDHPAACGVEACEGSARDERPGPRRPGRPPPVRRSGARSWRPRGGNHRRHGSSRRPNHQG